MHGIVETARQRHLNEADEQSLADVRKGDRFTVTWPKGSAGAGTTSTFTALERPMQARDGKWTVAVKERGDRLTLSAKTPVRIER